MTSTLLVVGSAPCLFDDLEKALHLRPLAAIMLVNGACTAIERVDHVLAGHTDKCEQFAAARRKRFPNAPPWRLHATVAPKFMKDVRSYWPSVTDFWDKTYCTGATSVAKGVEIGFRGLGFDEVILCGAPMDGSGYFSGEGTAVIDCHRLGDPTKQMHRVIEGYRRKFKEKFAPRYRDRLFSMSGFTRSVVGEPT